MRDKVVWKEKTRYLLNLFDLTPKISICAFDFHNEKSWIITFLFLVDFEVFFSFIFSIRIKTSSLLDVVDLMLLLRLNTTRLHSLALTPPDIERFFMQMLSRQAPQAKSPLKPFKIPPDIVNAKKRFNSLFFITKLTDIKRQCLENPFKNLFGRSNNCLVESWVRAGESER